MADEDTSIDEEITIHNFSERLLDNLIHFHVMKMKDSLFIWIGNKPELNSLSVAMCTKFATTPVGTNLLGELTDVTSNTMAQKFARKLKKQCFVSCNIPPEKNLLSLVESRIVKEIENNQANFWRDLTNNKCK